jgi:Zn-finger nucleic acid-binding protein
MNCPACRASMAILEYNGVDLDFCFSCRGCWLDAGELGLILNGTPDRPEDLKLEKSSRGKRRCPRCGSRMRVGPAPATGVEVDACPAGHGLWLDAGELEQIVKARGASGRAEAVAAFCAGVFGSKASQ